MADMYTYLLNADCPNGFFVILNNNRTSKVPTNFAIDLGLGFYQRGLWRQAYYYVCAANLSESIWFSAITPIVADLSGVDLSSADLTYTNFSQVILSQVLPVNQVPYTLSANLSQVLYNDLTQWPTNFIPPVTAIKQDINLTAP